MQVGRTGKLTPVAHLTPVALAGTTVARATLHNEEEIARKDVREGDTVLIERGGEVIPKVVSVVLEKRPHDARPWTPPERCPVCGEAVVRAEGEVDRRCVNASCPAQVEEKLKHFARREAMDVEGLGDSLVHQLVAKGLVHDFADLYALQLADLVALERMAEKSARNLLEQLERSRSRELRRLLFGLGIRFVGERAAQLLARHFRSLEALAAASVDEIDAIYEIGPTVAESVHGWFHDPANLRLVSRLEQAGLRTREEQAAAGVAGPAGQAVRADRRARVDDAGRGEGGDRGAGRARHVLRVEEDLVRGRGQRRGIQARQGEGAGRADARRGRLPAAAVGGVTGILPLMSRAAALVGFVFVAVVGALLGFQAGGRRARALARGPAGARGRSALARGGRGAREPGGRARRRDRGRPRGSPLGHRGRPRAGRAAARRGLRLPGGSPTATS